MAKYYVQSGNIRTVVDAQDAEKAALWVVHRALQQVIPVYEDDELPPQQKEEMAVVNGIMVLGNDIRISEIGFDRADANATDTFDLVIHWHQLMIALTRLQSMLD
ncbi:MAG: hypothetical protein KDB03_27665 [Planctomycetales bacterium]|nr:hypothetical protein [Planctomycetales bacterium]